MNKTVTINISGIIFHIEEDAYDKLSKYLNTIKGYFTKNESGNEIIADIEARIAELLQSKVSQFKQVVLMNDVDAVINALGKPEEFGIEGEEKESSQTQTNETFTEPVKKRMFRDPDEKAIGGVCSGVAHYFDVDVVWIRLATFLLIFFGGVSLWVYIILWIVIPEARTTADKLAMRGERINIDNISRSFKDEVDGVKSRMSDGFRSAGQATNTVAGRIAMIIGTIFRVIGRLFGAFLIFIGIIFMILLMTSITGISFGENSNEVRDWTTIFFNDRSYYYTGLIGLMIAIAVPAFMLLYGGIKLLFRIKYSNRWLNISAGIIWLFGVILATYAGVNTASDFSESSKYKETKSITSSVEVFTITATSGEELISKYHIEDVDFGEDEKHHFHRNDYSFGLINNKKALVGGPELKVIASTTGNFEIVVNKKARGNEKRSAYDRAKQINYNYSFDTTHVTFDELFYLTDDQKFRMQEIEIIVKVPKGKTIFLDPSLKHIIYDVDNVTNTYDQDMLNRRWKMTDRGLECVDCSGLDVTSSESEDGEEKVQINKDGININGDGANIVIDEKGININTNDHDIKLKKKEKKKED